MQIGQYANTISYNNDIVLLTKDTFRIIPVDIYTGYRRVPTSPLEVRENLAHFEELPFAYNRTIPIKFGVTTAPKTFYLPETERTLFNEYNDYDETVDNNTNYF